MKKPAIILWIILGLLLVLAIVVVLIPYLFDLYIFGKALGYVISVIGGLIKWIIVAIIIIAVLAYLFTISH